MYRVNHRGGGIDDDDTMDEAREIVQEQPPGRYDVGEIRVRPFPSGHSSRSWGRLIRRPDGRSEDEPWSWSKSDDLPRASTSSGRIL
jgi:hypothetical protein